MAKAIDGGAFDRGLTQSLSLQAMLLLKCARAEWQIRDVLNIVVIVTLSLIFDSRGHDHRFMSLSFANLRKLGLFGATSRLKIRF